MKDNNESFDWFKWAELEPRQYDTLVIEARKYDVPIFELDKKEDIFNRILAFKAYKNNKTSLFYNKILTCITVVSALISVVSNFY